MRFDLSFTTVPLQWGEKEEVVGANGRSRSNEEAQVTRTTSRLYFFYWGCCAIAGGREEKALKANGRGGRNEEGKGMSANTTLRGESISGMMRFLCFCI